MMSIRNRGRIVIVAQWLIAAIASGFLSTIPTLVRAEDTFDNDAIQFNVNTIVEFEFLESHGAYQSTFGVINLDTGEKTPLFIETKPSDSSIPESDLVGSQTGTESSAQDDFLGTPGNTVPTSIAEFEFKASTRYAFYLESSYNGKPVGVIYSTNSQNPDNAQLVRFQGGFANLANQGVTIAWDDTGSALVGVNSEDRDFDDFTIRAGGRLECPYRTINQTSRQSSTSSDNTQATTNQTSCK